MRARPVPVSVWRACGGVRRVPSQRVVARASTHVPARAARARDPTRHQKTALPVL